LKKIPTFADATKKKALYGMTGKKYASVRATLTRAKAKNMRQENALPMSGTICGITLLHAFVKAITIGTIGSARTSVKATLVNLRNMPSAAVVTLTILREHTVATARKGITGHTLTAKKILKRIKFLLSPQIFRKEEHYLDKSVNKTHFYPDKSVVE
jgi:hypothetical protein